VVELTKAYVLINSELGSEERLIEDIKKIEGVTQADRVYGVYDLIAQVEAESSDRLKQIVTGTIRRMSGVRSTLTMIVIE